jgi:hypothetical protein
MNILNLINFVSEIAELKPILILDDPTANALERNSIFMIKIPRLNLLTGGALGSSAAIFVLLALIIFIEKTIIDNKILKYIAIILLTVSSLLTASNSVITPFLVLFILFFFKFKFVKKIQLIFLFITIASISTIYFEFNPIFYITNYLLEPYISYFGSLTLNEILYGVGPRINTVGFNYINENKFIIDVGFVRVFVETGILNFIFFLLILFYTLHNAFIIFKYQFSINSYKFILILITFLLLIHGNFSIMPPFYPLFAISVAGILINYNKIKYIYVKK